MADLGVVWTHGDFGNSVLRGRTWINVRNQRNTSIRFEWDLLKKARFCHAYLKLGGEDDFQISIALPFVFAFWFSVRNFVPYRWLPRRWPHETGIDISQWDIHISLWHDDSGWTKEKPWQYLHVDLLKLIFGDTKYETRDLSSEDVEVVMPEASYPATIRMFESTWTWPRFKPQMRVVRADVELKKPIPVPGKGENSWDCGEDGIYGGVYCASTSQEAVEAIRASALRQRKQS
jgi:hypothetical protein